LSESLFKFKSGGFTNEHIVKEFSKLIHSKKFSRLHKVEHPSPPLLLPSSHSS